MQLLPNKARYSHKQAHWFSHIRALNQCYSIFSSHYLCSLIFQRLIVMASMLFVYSLIFFIGSIPYCFPFYICRSTIVKIILIILSPNTDFLVNIPIMFPLSFSALYFGLAIFLSHPFILVLLFFPVGIHCLELCDALGFAINFYFKKKYVFLTILLIFLSTNSI